MPSANELFELVQAIVITLQSQQWKTDNMINRIVEEIVGTKQVRLGPRPAENGIQTLRSIVSYYVNRGQPIPFLTPWGSEKSDGTAVDLAEFVAIKMLNNLQTRIQHHYSPGIVVHIRVEDVSAPHLFWHRAALARKEAQVYSDAFELLVHVVGGPHIKVKRETGMVAEEVFNTTADQVMPYMRAHLLNVGDVLAFQMIKSMGWRIPVSHTLITEHLQRYELLYPEKTSPERFEILVRYFSGAMSRYLLGIRGHGADWVGGFVDLSFSASAGVSAPNRVHYRTLPTSLSSNHIPPWRAKGYLAIAEQQSRPRLCSFAHKEPDLRQGSVLLKTTGKAVTVNCDWKYAN